MSSKIVCCALLFAVSVGCSPSKSPGPKAPPTSNPVSVPAAAKSSKVSLRSSPLPIGERVVMGDTEMRNVDGTMTTIVGVKGAKGTLVVFTCNHCPYAKAWESRLARIGNAAQKMGFGVIAINPNDPTSFPTDGFEAMQARAKEVGFEFPYVVDATSDVARAFGASKTPEVFLFDAADKLVYYGAVDDNYQDASKVEQNYLEDALKAVTAGTTINKSVTKALGCSIKYRAQS